MLARTEIDVETLQLLFDNISNYVIGVCYPISSITDIHLILDVEDNIITSIKLHPLLKVFTIKSTTEEYYKDFNIRLFPIGVSLTEVISNPKELAIYLNLE